MIALAEISPGTFIGDRYRIEMLLGQGGFGRTYLVSDGDCFGALCVLKEFVPPTTETSAIKKSLELFQREAKVLQKLNHPQIPKFLNWFEESGRVCIILEYIDGKTYWQLLKERLARSCVFSEVEVKQLLEDLLPVLDYLHTCHVIHRDLSPDNIMLCQQTGKPILIDLGIVKEAVTQSYCSHLGERTTIASVSLVGKRGYSPPEQMLMGHCFPNSDLYSLAVTALVLMTGRSPTELFDSLSMEWCWQQNLEMNESLKAILSRMLAEKPKERFQSAREVTIALAACQIEEKTNANALLNLDDEPPTISFNTPISLEEVLEEETQTAIFISAATPAAERISPPQELIERKHNLTSPQKKNKFKLGALAAIAIATSGIALAFQAPFVPGLCQTLNNCAKDRRYQTVYQEEIDRAQEAIATAKKAQTVNELKTARDRLNQSLTELQTIPRDVNVYPQAQQTLREYRASYAQIETQVSQEIQAEKQLKQAETPIARATQTSEKAKNLTDYREAIAQWEKVNTHLKTIPDKAIVIHKAKLKMQVERVNAQTKDLQSKIDRQLRAQVKSRQAIVQKNVQNKTRTTVRTSRGTTTTTSRTARRSTPSRVVSRPRRTQVTTPRRVNVRRNPRTTSRSTYRNTPSRSRPLWDKSSPSRSTPKKPLW
jgi:serine/threonine-protein kinase